MADKLPQKKFCIACDGIFNKHFVLTKIRTKILNLLVTIELFLFNICYFLAHNSVKVVLCFFIARKRLRDGEKIWKSLFFLLSLHHFRKKLWAIIF